MSAGKWEAETIGWALVIVIAACTAILCVVATWWLTYEMVTSV